jgi:hypothetical protein
MMQTSMQTSLLEKAIARILELSADLQIQRRATSRYSLAFHEHSVAIAAYGDALTVLTALQQQEECAASAGLLKSLGASLETRAIA